MPFYYPIDMDTLKLKFQFIATYILAHFYYPNNVRASPLFPTKKEEEEAHCTYTSFVCKGVFCITK